MGRHIEIRMFLLTNIVLALAAENKHQSLPNTNKQTTIYVHLIIQNPLVKTKSQWLNFFLVFLKALYSKQIYIFSKDKHLKL